MKFRMEEINRDETWEIQLVIISSVSSTFRITKIYQKYHDPHLYKIKIL